MKMLKFKNYKTFLNKMMYKIYLFYIINKFNKLIHFRMNKLNLLRKN